MIRGWNEESLDHRNALLYAIGVSGGDTRRPVAGLVNSWNEMNPGYFPLRDVVAEMKEEVYEVSDFALEFPVTDICDGICPDTPGDRYTLPTRDLVSNEVEVVVGLNILEGMVIMSTYDKVVPGMIMSALRVNIPAVMLTGGLMVAGHTEEGKMLTLIHTKQAYAACIADDISHDHYKIVVRNTCSTPDACPFMGTANTIYALVEILGLSLYDSASVRNQTSEWHEMARSAARRLVQAVRDNICPQNFITQEGSENAVRYTMATSGSVNSLLHIPAVARQIGCEVPPETFNRISREVPVISTIYPNHPTYTMEELSVAGGLGTVVEELIKAGKINTKYGGMFSTIDKKTEPTCSNNMGMIRPVEKLIHEQDGLAVLHGNIGSESAIAKFSTVDPEVWKFDGPAKCYDSQDDVWNVILRDETVPDDVVIIHYGSPKESPGMSHMETFTAAALDKGMGKEIAFVSDGRFPGITGGLAIGRVSPEACGGGNLTLIENGDVIHIDIERRTFTIDINDREFDCRRASWKPVEKPTIDWLGLCRRNCTSAYKGTTIYQKK